MGYRGCFPHLKEVQETLEPKWLNGSHKHTLKQKQTSAITQESYRQLRTRTHCSLSLSEGQDLGHHCACSDVQRGE